MSEDVIQELYIAREKLSKVGNPNWDICPNSKTWSDYCQDIGVEKSND